MSNIYLVLKAERTLHKKRMFTFMHLAQDDSWRPVSNVIVIYINPFLAQQEYNNIISPVDSIIKTSLA